MTEKELIKQIKQLKEIKPRQEWVVLAKSEIFAEKQEVSKIPVQKLGDWKIGKFIGKIPTENPIVKWKLVIENSLGRRMAYSFATLLLFVSAGMVGFAQYTMPGDLLFPVRKITENSGAALSGQTSIKNNVATLNNRISDFAKVAKEGKQANITPAITEISTKALELSKDLKENPTDKETLKEIAVSLKTLASVPGADLNEIPEVKSLYQIMVENQINDLKEVSLTEKQQEILAEVLVLQESEEYAEALEKILSISEFEVEEENTEENPGTEENNTNNENEIEKTEEISK